MQRKIPAYVFFAGLGVGAVLCASPGMAGAQQLQRVPGSAPLTGTVWVMAESAGQRLPQNGLQPHFALRTVERFENGSEGELQDATDSCGNHLTGAYRAAGDRLHVSITSYTLLACKVSESMPRQGLWTDLAGNPRFQIHGSELDLFDSNGVVRARFLAAHRKN